TNWHVIADSDEITVALADRREFIATLLGADKGTDLAVLKIETDDGPLPALELGDSDAVRVGDIVLAIGNPFGVGQTVTSGIISAQTRTGLQGGAFLQTDAAINPGNSGGALVTLDRQLIGINTSILSRSGGSIGIGFAIPSNLVRVVVEGMVASGRVVRPWVGLTLQPVTVDIARSLGLARPSGLLVAAVHRLSPARDVGLDIGDIVATVDGHEVFDTDGFAFRLSTHRIGEIAEVVIIRHGERSELALPLIAAPENPPSDIRHLNGDHPLAGVVVANLSPALAGELRIDAMRSGVIVLRVDRGRASRLGVRVGDVIVEVAGTTIDLTATLEAVTGERHDEWAIAIERKGEILSVVVRG
ncbi:MAG: trypsin-like peptidase domain-containing protein, partial [Alphaproteobacteria bacterium]